MIRPALAAFALLLIAPQASAEPHGFVELATGVSTAVGDDEWKSYLNTLNFKLGGRVGMLFPISEKVQLGFEVAGDWELLNLDSGSAFADASLHRFHALFGGRIVRKLAPGTFGFARLDVGLDYISGTEDFTAGMVTTSCSGSTTGFAVEPGVGIVQNLGVVAIGAQLAVPMAFHNDDGNQCLDGTLQTFDADVMFTISTRM